MRGRWEYASISCLCVGTVRMHGCTCTQVIAGVGVGVEKGVDM